MVVRSSNSFPSETLPHQALKSFKIPEKLAPEGFPTSALREISSLLSLTHPNVIEVIEVVVDDLNRVFMVSQSHSSSRHCHVAAALGYWVLVVEKRLFFQSVWSSQEACVCRCPLGSLYSAT